MPRTDRPSGGAGRSPRAGRSGASRKRRSRAALPTRAQPAANHVLRRANLTARAAILAVAVASVALALALPFKVWVAQRGQIHELQSATRTQEQRVAELRAQQRRWQDPSYVEQQARVRLHYALPGETTYVVLGKNKPGAKRTAPASTQPALSGPWYSRLWQSVETAGKASPTRP
jgi:cell division protein FtsB